MIEMAFFTSADQMPSHRVQVRWNLRGDEVAAVLCKRRQKQTLSPSPLLLHSHATEPGPLSLGNLLVTAPQLPQA